MPRIGRLLSIVGRGALGIVLPSPCVVCAGELPWRQREGSCCGSCWSRLPVLGGTRCRRCAVSLDTAAERASCGDCIIRPPAFEWLESYGPYEGGLDSLISALKFDGHHFLATPLAGLLARAVARRGETAFDLLASVPMEPRRERARGFNQADLLARALGKKMGVPYQPALLRRTGASRVQSRLPRAERRANVRRRFIAEDRVRGSSVLLVDDICTTGETLRECARVLRRAGAAEVAAVTVARA